jgi:hypothetical protein
MDAPCFGWVIGLVNTKVVLPFHRVVALLPGDVWHPQDRCAAPSGCEQRAMIWGLVSGKASLHCTVRL